MEQDYENENKVVEVEDQNERLESLPWSVFEVVRQKNRLKPV